MSLDFPHKEPLAQSIGAGAFTTDDVVADHNTTNPLVNSRPSLEHIESTPSSQDGIPHELEELLKSYGTSLIQSCGILLKL